LATLLQRLPASANSLRLIANGGWDRPDGKTSGPGSCGRTSAGMAGATAGARPTPQGTRSWRHSLRWPLDESLRHCPSGSTGTGAAGKVRRPALEAIQAPAWPSSQACSPRLNAQHRIPKPASARRWLQTTWPPCSKRGPPHRARLAPGWRPAGALFSGDPSRCGQRPGRAGGVRNDLSWGQCQNDAA